MHSLTICYINVCLFIGDSNNRHVHLAGNWDCTIFEIRRPMLWLHNGQADTWLLIGVISQLLSRRKRRVTIHCLLQLSGCLSVVCVWGVQVDKERGRANFWEGLVKLARALSVRRTENYQVLYNTIDKIFYFIYNPEDRLPSVRLFVKAFRAASLGFRLSDEGKWKNRCESAQLRVLKFPLLGFRACGTFRR